MGGTRRLLYADHLNVRCGDQTGVHHFFHFRYQPLKVLLIIHNRDDDGLIVMDHMCPVDLRCFAVSLEAPEYRGATTLFDDPLRIYLNEIDRIPPLGNGEESRCVAHVRAGDEEAEVAAMRLLETHLRLVVSIAASYCDTGIQILDLVQRGQRGLAARDSTFANELGA